MMAAVPARSATRAALSLSYDAAAACAGEVSQLGSPAGLGTFRPGFSAAGAGGGAAPVGAGPFFTKLLNAVATSPPEPGVVLSHLSVVLTSLPTLVGSLL